MVLSAQQLSINYGMRQILHNVSLYLNDGDKVGIVGINGTGKSTLLRILAGAEEPDAGEVIFTSGCRVSYLAQRPDMDPERTVLEQVMADADTNEEYECKSMLQRLGLGDFDQKVGSLSGGQRKRAALAAALLRPAELLLLDEPTNHLDGDMIVWLEDFLRRFKGSIVMITHDRYFLERVCNRIVEIDKGSLYCYEANYSKYLELKAERYEMAEASERKRQALLRRETAWIMRGARARSTKSRDRIERYEALKAQSGPEPDEKLSLSAASSRLGKKCIELIGVDKAYDGRTVLQPFSCHINRRDRIGVVGCNGAGKSTLLNIIAGLLPPDSGTVDTGATVKIGYFTQEGDRSMDPKQRVYDFITGIAREIRTDEGTFTASQMLEKFLFPGDTQRKFIGGLSGGERRRLYLLSVLMSAPNVLLMDEPTNDLDTETLTILEDYLDSFQGAVITVSHDRYFLDKIAEQIFEVCAGGEIRRYTGNWSDYNDKRPKEEESAPVKAKKDATPAKPTAPKQQKLKFSFKEQYEFEHIDEEIAALEQQIADCDTEIAAAVRDYVKLQEWMEKKDKLEAQLAEKEERWLYLNDLAERIAAQK